MKLTKEKIYCFTPLVSLGTFITEVVLAIYTLIKYRKTEFGIVSFFVLLALASFQLPEYLLCINTPSLYTKTLIQVGFIGTIFLPSLGLHLVNILNNKKYTRFVYFGYILAVVVSLMIALGDGSNFMHVCSGNYIRFELGNLVTTSYFFTYIILITSSIIILLTHIFKNENRKLNLLMLASFMVFLVPTYTLYFLSFVPNNGIPSVLCGFAILAALILVAKILPEYHKSI